MDWVLQKLTQITANEIGVEVVVEALVPSVVTRRDQGLALPRPMDYQVTVELE